MKKHWYKQYVEECPVCGSSRIFRERVNGEKPKDPSELIIYEQRFDYCNV